MKRWRYTLLLIMFPLFAAARDGYRIEVRLKERRDSMIYLAHYYGRNFPTVYKSDSARVNKDGVAVLERNEKVVGGIYLLLPSDRSSYIELLLDNGSSFTVTTTLDEQKNAPVFAGSRQNEDFLAYKAALLKASVRERELKEQLSKAVTRADSTAIYERGRAERKAVEDYRLQYIQKHPGTLLASIFSAMRLPEIPAGPHLTAAGRPDSSFAYRYYRSHYWEHFNFSDDRLIHTPLLQNQLDEYFNKVLPQQEDTVIREADTILAKMRGSENLFKFTLNWLSTNAQTTKVMGMDKVFVHLVEQYYMKGDAPWLGPDDLKKYVDRAGKIAPNVINAPAPAFTAVTLDKKPLSLYDFGSRYTLLIFYSSDCGHCQQELPLIDSAYRAGLKERGVRVLAFNLEKKEDQWRSFIEKNRLEDWTHVWDPEYKTRYWALYDTQLVPAIYLLDEEKIIRGKKLNHANIGKVLDLLERRGQGTAP